MSTIADVRAALAQIIAEGGAYNMLPLVHEDTKLPPPATVDALDARYAQPARGVAPFGKLVQLGCAIRNTGAGFAPISDSGHIPLGVKAVRELNGDILVDYDFTATRVVSFSVTPDETMATLGYSVGASVGLKTATIRVGQSALWADYISWDAANGKLKSFNGLAHNIDIHPQSTFAAQGWLRYDFNSPVSFAPGALGGQVASRNAAQTAIFEGVGTSGSVVGAPYGGFNFRFVDPLTREPILAPDLTQVKVWATINSTLTRKVAPSELAIAGSNFWIQGAFEVA
jgi:hypothetical protein